MKTSYKIIATVAAASMLTGCYNKEYKEKLEKLAHAPFNQTGVAVGVANNASCVFIDVDGDQLPDKELTIANTYGRNWVDCVSVGDTIKYRTLMPDNRTIILPDNDVVVRGLNKSQRDSLIELNNFRARAARMCTPSTVHTK